MEMSTAESETPNDNFDANNIVVLDRIADEEEKEVYQLAAE